jgi:hypothetical protein
VHLDQKTFPEMLSREKELKWIRKLAIEYDNIRAAVDWGLSSDPISVMRLVRSLIYLMVVTSYAGEGHRWGAEALEQVERLTSSGRNLTAEEKQYRARLLAGMSIMSFSMEDNRATDMEAE